MRLAFKSIAFMYLFSLPLLQAAEQKCPGGNGTKCGGATTSAVHKAKPPFQHRIRRLEKRIGHLHKKGKLNDKERDAFLARLAEIRKESEAAASDGFVSREERKALLKKLRDLQVDVAEAAHGKKAADDGSDDDADDPGSGDDTGPAQHHAPKPKGVPVKEKAHSGPAL